MDFAGRMERFLISGYERTVLRHPLATLLTAVLLVGALGVFAPRFQLDASSETLVMENDEAVRYYRSVRARYESDDFLVVTYTPEGGLFTERSLDRLEALRDALAEIEQVEEVTSLLDVPVLEGLDASLTELPTESEALTCDGPDRVQDCKRLLDSDLYRNLLISPDGTTSGIRVMLEQDERLLSLKEQRDELRIKAQEEGLSEAEQAELSRLEEAADARGDFLREREAEIIAQVRTVLDRFRDGARLHLGGVPMIAVDSISFIRHDLVVFGAAVTAFIILILFTAFRQPRWVLLPVATCTATVIAMIGLLGLLGWPVTVVSSNFVSLLLILNLALCVHLVVRYREIHEQQPEWDQCALVRETVFSKFYPCLYTVLTTMVAFGSLLVIGLGIAFLLSFTLFPAALLLLRAGKPPRLRNVTGNVTGGLARLVRRRPVAIVVLSAVLGVIGLAGSLQLSIENRFI